MGRYIPQKCSRFLLYIFSTGINLVNTLIATTLSRKHEFSVLRSVGMAKKQLRQTVQCEGILLAFWNICIAVLIGTAVGYGIVRYLNYVGDDTWVWHFPAVHFPISITCAAAL